MAQNRTQRWLAVMVLPKSIEGTGQQMRQLRRRLGHQIAKRSRARFDVGSTRLKREHHRCPEMHVTPLPREFDSTPDRFRRNTGAKYLGFDGGEALRA